MTGGPVWNVVHEWLLRADGRTLGAGAVDR